MVTTVYWQLTLSISSPALAWCTLALTLQESITCLTGGQEDCTEPHNSHGHSWAYQTQTGGGGGGGRGASSSPWRSESHIPLKTRCLTLYKNKSSVYKFLFYLRCGSSLVAHRPSGQRSRVRIQHLPQWSWCAAGSLCNKVIKISGWWGKPNPEAKKRFKNKLLNIRIRIVFGALLLSIKARIPLTCLMPGMVRLVSAMLVASTSLR